MRDFDLARGVARYRLRSVIGPFSQGQGWHIAMVLETHAMPGRHLLHQGADWSMAAKGGGANLDAAQMRNVTVPPAGSMQT
ncbi:hypothetical protein YP76_11520 [Sphingobium chungbukense]|uniref:Uncharacterized protein n=1 Tax=Sphingobium chungbukense TaxID=56193 RepID=A0A0M3ANN1_9SPHN|nr:hypothetical protein YP76_11520 [Sphingobium chungbukense]